MIGSCLCLFVFVVFFIFADVYCHILHLRFFVVCSSPIPRAIMALAYTRYIGIQTNCSIFLASKSSVHSFYVKTLVIFHATYHVTALDQ